MRLCLSCTPFGSGVCFTKVIIGRQRVDISVSPSISLSRGTYSAPGPGRDGPLEQGHVLLDLGDRARAWDHRDDGRVGQHELERGRAEVNRVAGAYGGDAPGLVHHRRVGRTVVVRRALARAHREDPAVV